MIEVWRINKAQYDPLSGGGAAQYGGRWNPKGMPLVYTSQEPGSATIEKLVHVEFSNPPENLRLYRIGIPDDIPRPEIGPKDLFQQLVTTPATHPITRRPASDPFQWTEAAQFSYLRGLGEDEYTPIGAKWIRRGDSPVLVVPSLVVPHSKNVLINPKHPLTDRIEVLTSEPFQFDPRTLP